MPHAQLPAQLEQVVSRNPKIAKILVPLACRAKRCDMHCMTYDQLAEHMWLAHGVIADPQGTFPFKPY